MCLWTISYMTEHYSPICTNERGENMENSKKDLMRILNQAPTTDVKKKAIEAAISFIAGLYAGANMKAAAAAPAKA